jgi:competence ComEA-like helix-hairpin-helix protein
MSREFLKDYFNFTKKERKGIIYTVALILTLILFSFFSPYFIKRQPLDHTQFEKEIAQLQADSSAKKLYASNSDDEYFNDHTAYQFTKVKKVKAFFFDPNTATVSDWLRLGIKQRTAETIQKYVAKGGRFHQPEDLKKIWGLGKADIDRLLPYVSIKNTKLEYPQPEKKIYPEKSYSFTPRAIQKVDINLADTTAFIALPGIGSKLSKRIIAFREKLGGFYMIDQIGETYLLPDSTFQKVKPHLVMGNTPTKKININTASVNEMKTHPYIRYNLANAIFQYRQQHGNFNSIEEIKKILIITDEIYLKIAPYLIAE